MLEFWLKRNLYYYFSVFRAINNFVRFSVINQLTQTVQISNRNSKQYSLKFCLAIFIFWHEIKHFTPPPPQDIWTRILFTYRPTLYLLHVRLQASSIYLINVIKDYSKFEQNEIYWFYIEPNVNISQHYLHSINMLLLHHTSVLS